MTERLYQHDSYQKSCDAVVRAVTEDGVVLDRTVFFPAGGGVLGDTGTLTRTGDGAAFEVTETHEGEGGLLHRVATAGLAVGDAVTATLNWERRYTLMRYHTATHVLCGVMFNDYNVRVTGNQLTPEKGRVDFSFETFDRAVLEEGFARSNALVDQDLPVHISFIGAEEAEARPELFKLETGFRHNLETLRLVGIGEWDIQADGGCHVASLKEVGYLTLTKSENKGKSNRRVYYLLDA